MSSRLFLDGLLRPRLVGSGGRFGARDILVRVRVKCVRGPSSRPLTRFPGLPEEDVEVALLVP
eukprot:491285-Prorocentrum_lima.AAC.1